MTTTLSRPARDAEKEGIVGRAGNGNQYDGGLFIRLMSIDGVILSGSSR